ncbi:MAG: hypothetical protein B7Z55_17985, partial [Planctomycetales bacterium 12-60-4]
MGSKPEEQTPVVVAPPVNPMPPAPPSPPPPPPKPKAEEVIAKFLALRPQDVDNGHLQELLSLDEGLEAITELQLINGGINSAGIRNLDRLTHLARLDIRSSPLDQTAFAHIGKVTSLEELQLDGGRLTPETSRDLAGLSNLKVFVAEGMQLTPFAWEEFFAAHPNLEDLDISRSNLTDLATVSLGKLANLKRLQL